MKRTRKVSMEYRNLMTTCKLYGFINKKCGTPSFDELYSFIYKNMHRDPISQVRVVNPKYNNLFYWEIADLAKKHGFQGPKQRGRVSFKTYQQFLKEKNIDPPKESVVMNQRRKTINDCKTPYLRLLFRAKALGFKRNVRGRVSKIDLENFIKTKKGTK